MHVLSCCFAYIRLLLFCRSCCRRPRRCLSSLSANKSYHCTHQRYHASLKTTKTEKESYYFFSLNHLSLPEKVTTSIKRIIVLKRFKNLFVLCIISQKLLKMCFPEHLLKAAIAGPSQHKVAHTPLLLQVEKYVKVRSQ